MRVIVSSSGVGESFKFVSNTNLYLSKYGTLPIGRDPIGGENGVTPVSTYGSQVYGQMVVVTLGVFKRIEVALLFLGLNDCRIRPGSHARTYVSW